jgi:hypothetical protein
MWGLWDQRTLDDSIFFYNTNNYNSEELKNYTGERVFRVYINFE